MLSIPDTMTSLLSIPDPRRAAIGCTRISTQGQREGYGQEVQAAEITREAARLGLDLVEIVPEVESGTRELAGRATVQRYFELAEQHRGLTFIFPRVDRIGRRAELILSIVRELHERRATVHVIGITADLRSREGMFYLTMLSGVAEMDHGSIRDRMEAGRRRKAQAGLWPHGSPPWGYVMGRDERGAALLPVPVPDQAAAIRRLYELAVEHGESDLVRTMRAEGWPAPTPLGWVRKSVNNVLTSPYYGGQRVYQGITVEFEPIVPADLLAQVHAARAARRTSGGPKTAAPLLLTGHLRCVCGSAMGRDVDKSGYKGKVYNTYTFYRCWKAKRAHLDAPAAPVQHARPQFASKMDALCWAALCAALTDPERLADLLTPTEAGPSEPPTGRVQQLEAAIERAYEPLTAGAPGYTLAIAQNLARPYADELSRLRAEYAAKAAPPAPDLDAHAAAFRVMLASPMSFEDQRELLRVLRARFVMGPGGLESIGITLP